MNFHQKIKNLRLEKKQSQSELAELLHVTPQAVSKWENNKSVPDLMTLVAISDLYGVSLDYLIKGDQKLQEKLSAGLKLKHFFISFGVGGAATILLFFAIGIMSFLTGIEFFINYWAALGAFFLFFFSILLSPFIQGKKAKEESR